MVCVDEGEDERTARYAAVDAGAAIAQLTIEAVSRGLIAHPMAGFNADGAAEVFSIPAGVRPIAVVAVGSLGDYDNALPEIVERDAQGRGTTAAGGDRVRGTLGTVVSAVAVASAHSVVSSQKSVVSRQFFLFSRVSAWQRRLMPGFGLAASLHAGFWLPAWLATVATMFSVQRVLLLGSRDGV